MTPREVVKAFHHAFVSRDVDALMALYAEGAVNHQVAEEPLNGKEAIRRSFEDFFAAFPGETTEALNVFEDGEWGIWEWRGGPPSAPPDAPTVNGCGFFQVRDGKIVFQRGYWDKLTFLRAHGLPLPTR
ncbi:MAG TPA: nuclear transport factor 2 family protein [Anaeromyxobacter sp.]|jgi:ketosteroid isomerase-like protein|nr:nuclear transport factor 2 family protein [Anaeromyxobacter sp.]